MERVSGLELRLWIIVAILWAWAVALPAVMAQTPSGTVPETTPLPAPARPSRINRHKAARRSGREYLVPR